jgi:hypothetical protein
MEEDVLDYPITELENSKKGILNLSTKLILALLIFLVVATNIFICIKTIPDSAKITSPEYISNVRVIYFMSFVILFIMPAISFMVSAILALMPFRKIVYKQKLISVFIILLLLLELVTMKQIIADLKNY